MDVAMDKNVDMGKSKSVEVAMDKNKSLGARGLACALLSSISNACAQKKMPL